MSRMALAMDLQTLGKITIVVALCCSLPIGQHLDQIDEGHAVYSVPLKNSG